MVVDSGQRSNFSTIEFVKKCLEGGAQLVQLRQKGADRKLKRKWAEEITGFKRSYPFTFIINDDPELVLEVNADGVHLGQGDMKVSDARQILGREKIIGKSTHSLDEAIKAEREEIDYIACGAIFPTTSKPKGHPVVGLRGLKEVSQNVRIPVVAIGGINRSNIEDVVKTGVSSVAMISALMGAENIAEEVQYYIGFFKPEARNRKQEAR